MAQWSILVVANDEILRANVVARFQPLADCADRFIVSSACQVPTDVARLRDFHLVVFAGALNNIGELASASPGLRFLGLALQIDCRKVFEVMAAGARGCVGANVDAVGLQKAAGLACRDMISLPPEIFAALSSAESAVPATPVDPVDVLPDCKLTPRERAVFDLLVMGHSNKRIARVLDIAPGTVKNYVSRLLSEFGAATRTHLIAQFARQRMLA